MKHCALFYVPRYLLRVQYHTHTPLASGTHVIPVNDFTTNPFLFSRCTFLKNKTKSRGPKSLSVQNYLSQHPRQMHAPLRVARIAQDLSFAHKIFVFKIRNQCIHNACVHRDFAALVLKLGQMASVHPQHHFPRVRGWVVALHVVDDHVFHRSTSFDVQFTTRDQMAGIPSCCFHGFDFGPFSGYEIKLFTTCQCKIGVMGIFHCRNTTTNEKTHVVNTNEYNQIQMTNDAHSLVNRSVQFHVHASYHGLAVQNHHQSNTIAHSSHTNKHPLVPPWNSA